MVISWFIEQKGPEFFSQAFAEEPADTGSGNADGAAVGGRNRQANAEGTEGPGSSPSGLRSRSRLFWIIGAAAAVVLLLAAGLVFHPWGGNQVQTASSAAPGPETSTLPAASQPAPVQVQPAQVAPTQPAPTQAAPVKAAPPIQPPQSAPKPKPGEQKVPPPAPQSDAVPPPKVEPVVKPPKQPDSRCDLDPSQYTGAIAQAETNMGRGKYSAAARQFDAVLACDPGNARAREGRERVRQAQSAEEGPSQ